MDTPFLTFGTLLLLAAFTHPKVVRAIAGRLMPEPKAKRASARTHRRPRSEVVYLAVRVPAGWASPLRGAG